MSYMLFSFVKNSTPNVHIPTCASLQRSRAFRRSSQTKNTPPTRPLTMPMGISSGRMMVRAAISAQIRNTAPANIDGGRTRALSPPHHQPHDMRDHQANKADDPRKRDHDPSDHGGNDESGHTEARDGNAQRGRRFVPDGHGVERSGNHAKPQRSAGQHQCGPDRSVRCLGCSPYRSAARHYHRRPFQGADRHPCRTA